MRESRSSGSVEGVTGNRDSYSDSLPRRVSVHEIGSTPENGNRSFWDVRNGHALVLKFRGFSVGIRGYRAGGVRDMDLFNIAESLR
jgi:hypothetical protein